MLNRFSQCLFWEHMMLMGLPTTWNNGVAGLTSLIIGVLRWSSQRFDRLIAMQLALLFQWLSEIHLTTKKEHLGEGGDRLACSWRQKWHIIFAYRNATIHRRFFIVGCLRPRLVRISSSSFWLIEKALISFFIVICNDRNQCVLSWQVSMNICVFLHIVTTAFIFSMLFGRWIWSGRGFCIFQQLLWFKYFGICARFWRLFNSLDMLFWDFWSIDWSRFVP